MAFRTANACQPVQLSLPIPDAIQLVRADKLHQYHPGQAVHRNSPTLRAQISMGNLGTTPVNKILRFSNIPAGNSYQLRVLCIMNGLPILLCNPCGTKNSPAAFFSVMKNFNAHNSIPGRVRIFQTTF